MARSPRIVVPGYPHHVTQRGSRRGDVFFCDEDRELYLALLKSYLKKFNADLIDYSLMRNHVHHMIVPREKTDLASIFGSLHNLYANIINARQGWTGHLWQERFYSSPLDETTVPAVSEYIVMNPVAAGIVQNPTDYPWSSARVRATQQASNTISLESPWSKIIGCGTDWLANIGGPQDPELIKKIEQSLYRDLPFGSEKFIDLLERMSGRILRPRPRGRPRKIGQPKA